MTQILIDKLGKKPINLKEMTNLELGILIRVMVNQLEDDGEYSWDRELTIKLAPKEDEE